MDRGRDFGGESGREGGGPASCEQRRAGDRARMPYSKDSNALPSSTARNPVVFAGTG